MHSSQKHIGTKVTCCSKFYSHQLMHLMNQNAGETVKLTCCSVV